MIVEHVAISAQAREDVTNKGELKAKAQRLRHELRVTKPYTPGDLVMIA